MKVLKTKEFNKYAQKESIDDFSLCQAVLLVEKGLIDVNLGNGLIKQRVARKNEGKRGGYRTLIAFKSNKLTIFLDCFAKNEKDNISQEKLEFWKKITKIYFNMTEDQINQFLESNKFIEVKCHV